MNIDNLILKLHLQGKIVGKSASVIEITNSQLFKASRYVLSYEDDNIYFIRLGMFNKVKSESKFLNINQVESYTLKNHTVNEKKFILYIKNSKRIDFNYYANGNDYLTNKKNIEKFIDLLKSRKIIRNNNIKDKEYE